MAERHLYVGDEGADYDEHSNYTEASDSLYSSKSDLYTENANPAYANYGEQGAASRYHDGIGDILRAPKQSASHLILRNARNWNTEFQLLLERPNRTPEDAKERIELIGNLISSFTQAATPIAKVIVAEEDLKLKDKTIAPVNVGGVAGGVKFVHNGMFIKLASKDPYGIYGSISKAAKSAAHEINSLQALIECNISNLHFPLQTIVDYLGRRLMMSSILPIDETTLIYGSGDGGKTILHSHPEARALTRQVAEQLNLSPHMCTATSTGEIVSVNVAVDIEAHLGKDGRIYIIDTARLFPPEPPIQGEKGSVFCRLLRRELLQMNPVPLSSDGFTNFGKHDSAKHNGDIRVAWTKMMTTSVPNCIMELETLVSGDFYSATDPQQKLVARVMHKHGINTRYLLHLRSLAHSPLLKFVLLAEAISRAVKREFFDNLREIKSTDGTQHAGLAVVLLNQLFTSSTAAKEFWDHLPSKLVECFPSELSVSLSDSSEVPRLDVLTEIFSPWKESNDFAMVAKCEQTLLRWVLYQCGIELHSDSLEALREQRKISPVDDLFRLSDIAEIKPKIKTISVGHILEKLRSEASGGSSSLAQQQEKFKFYRNQLNQRREVLGHEHPIVAFSLENCGDLMVVTGDREAAISFFDEALQIRRKIFARGDADEITVAETIEKIINSLHSFSMYEDALIYAREALDIVQRVYGAESTRAATLLHEEGSLLKGMGKYEESASKFRRTIMMSRNLSQSQSSTGASGSSLLASSLVEYARVQLHLGRDDEDIVQMQEEALQLSEKFWGPEHSRVATVLNNLGILLIWHGEYDRARPICERSLRIRLAALGRSHAYSGHSASALGQLHLLAGRFDQAAVYLTESCEIYETSKRGEPIAMGKSNYARLLMDQALIETDDVNARSKLLDEAQELLDSALILATADEGRKDQDQVATFLVDLAAIHLFRGQEETAKPLLERAKTIRLRCLSRADHPNLLIVDKILNSPREAAIQTSRRILVSQLTLYTSARTKATT